MQCKLFSKLEGTIKCRLAFLSIKLFLNFPINYRVIPCRTLGGKEIAYSFWSNSPRLNTKIYQETRKCRVLHLLPHLAGLILQNLSKTKFVSLPEFAGRIVVTIQTYIEGDVVNVWSGKSPILLIESDSQWETLDIKWYTCRRTSCLLDSNTWYETGPVLCLIVAGTQHYSSFWPGRSHITRLTMKHPTTLSALTDPQHVSRIPPYWFQYVYTCVC